MLPNQSSAERDNFTGERSARGVLAKYPAAAHLVTQHVGVVDESVDYGGGGEEVIAEDFSPSTESRCW